MCAKLPKVYVIVVMGMHYKILQHQTDQLDVSNTTIFKQEKVGKLHF